MLRYRRSLVEIAPEKCRWITKYYGQKDLRMLIHHAQTRRKRTSNEEATFNETGRFLPLSVASASYINPIETPANPQRPACPLLSCLFFCRLFVHGFLAAPRSKLVFSRAVEIRGIGTTRNAWTTFWEERCVNKHNKDKFFPLTREIINSNARISAWWYL